MNRIFEHQHWRDPAWLAAECERVAAESCGCQRELFLGWAVVWRSRVKKESPDAK